MTGIVPLNDVDIKRELNFLTVEEAAEKLGISRIRARESVLHGLTPARRDNQGRLRIDLSQVSSLQAIGLELEARGSIDETEILDLLFDELEELQETVDQKNSDIHHLSQFVERQAMAIRNTEKLLDRQEQQQLQILELLNRCLAQLEQGASRTEKFQRIAQQAIDLLERSEEELASRTYQRQELERLLSGSMAVSEIAVETSARTNKQLSKKLEAALDSADKALQSTEASDEKLRESQALLDRAVTIGERLQLLTHTKNEKVFASRSTSELFINVPIAVLIKLFRVLTSKFKQIKTRQTRSSAMDLSGVKHPDSEK
ncbi:MAG: hypothetical protein ACR2O3_00685 [Rhizobiaceae bacterium]